MGLGSHSSQRFFIWPMVVVARQQSMEKPDPMR
jgi:hypothetical protein